MCQSWRFQPQIHGFVFNREFLWPVVCVKQWHSQPKTIWEGTKCLVLGEQQHFVWDTGSQSTKWRDMLKSAYSCNIWTCRLSCLLHPIWCICVLDHIKINKRKNLKFLAFMHYLLWNNGKKFENSKNSKFGLQWVANTTEWICMQISRNIVNGLKSNNWVSLGICVIFCIQKPSHHFLQTFRPLRMFKIVFRDSHFIRNNYLYFVFKGWSEQALTSLATLPISVAW